MENEYNLPESNDAIEIRFQDLIEGIYKKTGRQVVVLVDEYDKPLLESMADEKLNAQMRAALKPFYGVLKGTDAALRFVMLTGVTRFSKVSIFSDLNQLNEIGMDAAFSGICGITEAELLENFRPELDALAEANDESFEETLAAMRRNFNGYRFTKKNEKVYNPFSILNTFYKQDIRYYWFETGTPTFLFKELKRTRFEALKFNEGISIDEASINDYRPGDTSPVPLLYQSGYLTITGFDEELHTYTLGFPNSEVKYGFLQNLYSYLLPEFDNGNGFDVISFFKALRAGEPDKFLSELKAFFAAIPYDLYFTKGESYYQTIFYLVFTLLGRFVGSEVRTAKGRADAVVKTRDTVYIFEFKLDSTGTAEDALKQIDERGYALPYEGGGKRVVKVGIVFDTENRTLGEWLSA
jgi:hypothetical protein